MYIGPVVFQKLTNEELFNQVVNLFKVIRLSPDSCEEDGQLEADAYLKYFCENKVSVFHSEKMKLSMCTSETTWVTI